MIELTCDRCEQTITASDDQAGRKIDCPHCGDVNRVPEGAAAPDRSSGPDRSSARADRAAARGLPPDSGPEVRVMRARPSLLRSRPFTSLVLGLGPLALALGVGAAMNANNADWQRFWYLFVGAPVLGWIILGGWALLKGHSQCLIVTNKRTIHRTGLFSRSTSEVMHDHVRNVEINQSFLDRVFRVGHVGLSSAGQFDIEIAIDDIPNPGALREIIDLYRPW